MMKKTLLKVATATLFTIYSSLVIAQVNWQKNGNNAFGGPPTLGTNGSWNAPLDFLTFGNPRMHINQNRNFDVGYFGGNPFHTAWYLNNYAGWGVLGAASAPNGFVGINTENPRTQLHIQGNQNCSSTLGSGFRPWMRTGVFMNEESNNMYVGMYRRQYIII